MKIALMLSAAGVGFVAWQALVVGLLAAYFSPSWTPFQPDGGRDFSVIMDGVSI